VPRGRRGELVGRWGARWDRGMERGVSRCGVAIERIDVVKEDPERSSGVRDLC
jgi:hypothetical protein